MRGVQVVVLQDRVWFERQRWHQEAFYLLQQVLDKAFCMQTF